MPTDRTIRVPAGAGRAVDLAPGDRLRVVNTFGTQVVDTWAVVPGDPLEHLSLGHCRELLQRIYFVVNDVLVTDRYRPVLRVVADSSPGEHDTLIAACSQQMYVRAGRGPEHASCAGNLEAALADLGLALPVTPAPWNLFMRAPVGPDGSIAYERPTARPGDAVELEALVACVVAVSSCPDDVYPTNGGDGSPRDVEIVVSGASGTNPSQGGASEAR